MPTPLTRREALAFSLGFFPFWPRSAVKLGEARFDVLRRGRSARRYLWIHGNEWTARETLVSHMENARGMAFLIRSEERNVPLLGGRLDPNRMFSRAGAERNLRRLNGQWDGGVLAKALDRLDRDREGFLRRLLPPRGGLLVALHNNSRGYSVQDELPISNRTSIRDERRPHEFLLCTDPADFERLSALPVNVVLQNSASAEDDGSLSRLAARRGVRYVNIEVGLGELAAQKELLGWVEEQLR